jgi:uncharacterized membrane protein
MMRFVFVLILMTASAQAEEWPALYSVTGVAANDSLNVREAPAEDAPVLGTLSFDAKGVEVLAIEDGWALMTDGRLHGHVAARFLTREAGPEWNALQQPLACIGTEPFWSLDLDPVAGTASYRTPEPSEAWSDTIGQTWPGAPWGPAAAVTLPKGTVVLYPQSCSDEMTDRAYGIGIDVFLTTPAGGRLTGCCSLVNW